MWTGTASKAQPPAQLTLTGAVPDHFPCGRRTNQRSALSRSEPIVSGEFLLNPSRRSASRLCGASLSRRRTDAPRLCIILVGSLFIPAVWIGGVVTAVLG